MKEAVEKAGVTFSSRSGLRGDGPRGVHRRHHGRPAEATGIPEGIDTVGATARWSKRRFPFAEITHYATDLRSMTGGQGTFSWSFSHYQEVPHDLAQKIIDAAQAEKEAAH